MVPSQGHAQGPVQSPGVGRALPTPWGSPSSFPACPKELSPRGTLPKCLLRRVRGGQAPQHPSAADHTSRERSTALARGSPASAHPASLGISRSASCASKASTGRCGHLFPWGEMCPRSGAAREVRLATRSLRGEQPEGGGSNPAWSLNKQLRDPGASSRWRGVVAGGWSASRSTLAFSCCWLLSHLPQPPPESRPAPRRCRDPHQSRRGERDRLRAVLGASACSDHIHGMEK